jgi:hypothetical protein
MSEIDNTPVSEEASATDATSADRTTDNPEIPVTDAVEQHTPVGAEDLDADQVWAPVPDDVDPADATEQRRVVAHPEEEDHR